MTMSGAEQKGELIAFQTILLNEIREKRKQKSHTAREDQISSNDCSLLDAYIDEIERNSIIIPNRDQLFIDLNQGFQLTRKLRTFQIAIQFIYKFKPSFLTVSTLTPKTIAIIIDTIESTAEAKELELINLLQLEIINYLQGEEGFQYTNTRKLETAVSQLVKVQRLDQNTKTLSVLCRNLNEDPKKRDTEHEKKAMIINRIINNRKAMHLRPAEELILNKLAGNVIQGLMYPTYLDEERAEFDTNFPELLNEQTLEENLRTLTIVREFSDAIASDLHNQGFNSSLASIYNAVQAAKLHATENDKQLLNSIVKKTILGLFYPQNADNCKEYEAIVRLLFARRQSKLTNVANAASNFNVYLGAAVILGLAATSFIICPWLAVGVINTACELIAGVLGVASVSCAVACCFFSAKQPPAIQPNPQFDGLYNAMNSIGNTIVKRQPSIFLH